MTIARLFHIFAYLYMVDQERYIVGHHIKWNRALPRVKSVLYVCTLLVAFGRSDGVVIAGYSFRDFLVRS